MRICAFHPHASIFFPRLPRPRRTRLRGRGTAGQTCCLAGSDRDGWPDSAGHRRPSHVDWDARTDADRADAHIAAVDEPDLVMAFGVTAAGKRGHAICPAGLDSWQLPKTMPLGLRRAADQDD